MHLVRAMSAKVAVTLQAVVNVNCRVIFSGFDVLFSVVLTCYFQWSDVLFAVRWHSIFSD